MIYRSHSRALPTHCAWLGTSSRDKWQSTFRRLFIEMIHRTRENAKREQMASFTLSWVSRWELFTLFALLCHVDTLLSVLWK